MVTTRPPKTIVKPTALGPVANTDTKLLIYGLFQKGRVLAQDGAAPILLDLSANREAAETYSQVVSNARRSSRSPYVFTSASSVRNSV